MDETGESSSLKPNGGASEEHKCGLCGRAFSKAVNYRLHLKRMHSKSHSCSSCDFSFDTQHELRKHVSVEHPKSYKCFMCNYTNKLKYQVKRHENQAHGERSVSCSYAGCAQLMPYRNLQRHIREAHSAEQPSTIVRLYANRSASGENGLSSSAQTGKSAIVHSKSATVHEEVARQAEAEKRSRVIAKAQKNFEEKIGSNPKNFKSLTSVITTATFKCEVCGAERETRDRLRRHIARVHEKRYVERKRERQYACTEPGCGRAFRCPALLDDHLNAHKGEYPFECLRCDKKYESRADYSRHLRRYHGTSIHALRHPKPLVNLDINEDSDNER